MNEDLAIVFTSTSNDQEADFLSDVLVKSKYVACVNILPNISSKYLWKGELQNTNEIILLIKTKKDYFKQIEKLIKINHTYELPEVICIDVSDASEEYRSWIINNLNINRNK